MHLYEDLVIPEIVEGKRVEAAVIDQRIANAWEGHPTRFIVESAADFLSKAHRAIEILRGEMPECCRRHLRPGVDQRPVGVER